MHEVTERIRRRREKWKERIRAEIERYGSGILDSGEMREAYRQTHHTRSTVGEHTRRVAEKSLAVCHALEKLRIRTDIPAVVTGALCHDLGILGRDGKYGSERECRRRHPADSVETARKLVDGLSETAEDIIARHMWPAAGSRAPGSPEGFIVSMADKAATIEDFFRGSSVKPADFRTTVQTIAKRSGIDIWKTKKRQ